MNYSTLWLENLSEENMTSPHYLYALLVKVNAVFCEDYAISDEEADLQEVSQECSEKIEDFWDVVKEFYASVIHLYPYAAYLAIIRMVRETRFYKEV